MDEEYRKQLQEQLRMLRRLDHADQMTLARCGYGADPSVHIRVEDRRKEIAQIEAQLGVERPQLAPRQEYVAREPYRPAPALERQRGDDTAYHVTLLGIHRSNLAHYTAQARRYGGVELAPPITQHGITEAREGIVREKRILRAAGVAVDNFADE